MTTKELKIIYDAVPSTEYQDAITIARGVAGMRYTVSVLYVLTLRGYVEVQHKRKHYYKRTNKKPYWEEERR